MPLPDFLIVGGHKCGSSTLYRYLGQHENVTTAERGEVHFFDENWDRGLKWYSAQFSPQENEILLGEKTPAYSYLPIVPERMYNTVPDVKLVWIFRNPISRAYSNYLHSIRAGLEYLDFEEALFREKERVADNMWYGYAQRGIYIDQVQRFERYYDIESMHFMLLSDLIHNTRQTMLGLLGFLSIPMTDTFDIKLPHYNPSFTYHSKRVQYLARRLFGRGRFPFRVISRLNRKLTPGYPPMSEEARSYLQEYFREPNRRLAKLTGLDLSAWEPSRQQ